MRSVKDQEHSSLYLVDNFFLSQQEISPHSVPTQLEKHQKIPVCIGSIVVTFYPFTSCVGEESQKKKFKQTLHSILMNILKESDSYLDFQQIFQRIKNYQTF